MSVAFQRTKGVRSVQVSLNQGLALIELEEGNNLALEQLRELIQDAGFTPKQAHVVARGEVVSKDGKFQLQLARTDQTYALVLEPQNRELLSEIQKHAGKTGVVEGTVPAVQEKKAPLVIHLQGFKD